MAAKATVAISTATTVLELMALFRPPMWSFSSLFLIFWTCILVCLVCLIWDWTSCLISLTVCLSCFAGLGGCTCSFAVTPPASLKMLTSSSLLSCSAMARAVCPDLLTAFTSIPSTDSRVCTICKELHIYQSKQTFLFLYV
ncbi:Os08g0542800 [Oryza sativa Japonica Group]|uniref:Os08g0542800 protein n=1 Tax=Oryza sativa subsp. japonica TaxID=39947 RepID=A0A0P0XI28_ORYSJ|nr:hypothetical protein EE612_045689 [Oryza sativa]BAT06507.1 Os08g0542800 [Oryza sativa Japonica Group]